MNDLLSHIKNLNSKTTQWVNEDPQNRFAGCLIEDLDHWNSIGITTPSELDHYNLVGDVYELHKSVYGFKPSYIHLKSLSTNELESYRISLQRDYELNRKEEVRNERISRKLRHAQHVTWVNRKKEILTHHTGFSIGILIGA